MPNYTTLTRATATSTGQWSDGHQLLTYQVWTPKNPAGGGNVAGYTAPAWPVVFFRVGGANMNPGDLDTNANSTYLMLVNELSCVMVAYDVTPGGFYETGVMDPRAKFFPDNYAEDAAAIAFFREHATDTSIWGTGGSITTDPDRSIHAGSSSGGWRVLKTQLMRDGDFDYAESAQTGESRFKAQQSHCCNFVFANQAQTLLSTFAMSKFSAAVQARADVDATLSTYLVDGTPLAGDTTVHVDGDTVALIKGNRITFNAGAQEYAITADYSGGEGDIAIFPSLQANLADNSTIEIVEQALEKYGNYAWCGGYFFSSADGYIWQNDIETSDSDAVFPWDIKRQGDCDILVTEDNPRVTEANWMFIGSSANTIIKSTLTGEFSFLEHAPAPYGTLADDTIDAAHNDLHGEFQSFLLAYALDACGNTSNVAVYAGNTTSNPDTEVDATNWNKGQNADFSASVFKAWLQARDFA